MKLNRWSAIVLSIAAAGVAGWVATGLQGWRLDPAQDLAGFALHTQLGFLSTLTLLLADVWIVLFLALAARATARLAADPAAARGARADARRVAVAGLLALALATCQAALSGALYPHRLRADAHLVLALAALLAELGFLTLAARALARQRARFAAS